MPALIIDGHPNAESLSAAIARRYAASFGDATLVALRDLDFDVHLRAGYRAEQPLEPDLERVWLEMVRADHIVIVTPIWWGATPALLSGFFDRVLLPRRAFRFSRLGLPVGLLAGRSGRLVVTTDSPRLFLARQGDPTVRAVRDGTMRYCGIAPAAVTRIGPVRGADQERREAWLARIEGIAARDAERVTRSAPRRARRAARLAEIPSRARSTESVGRAWDRH
ncbi:putative NADPH-quinone reductase [Labedella gwakjiensis]|uniref:Flavodoxin family protein n=1 Tax=Labedella gwakjiensis TaxID=390269 RepID=A0A2P8GVX6_9MICO|nr:NAD(P)H-dependent oxidoreductase [Labedella gwakjiensis]PSL38130.1 putative NADPH-quinone reductase [Labedella gwakjiensis]RUQ87320.1 flavodoxin family protein [Labedella gwakjiensis]